MNKYIVVGFRFVVFIVLLILIDQGVGIILRQLYFKQKTGQNHSLTYAFRDCKADVVIFGASQAQHNYDTRIIGDSLKMSCYNAGQDGGHSILLQYAQIKVITKRYSPKIIILDFDPKNIIDFPTTYDRLSILLPYYKKYPEIRPLINLRSHFERIKLLSAIYPFNSNIINIIRFNSNTIAARKKDFNGYIPIEDKIMNKEMGTPMSETKNSVIDTNMVNALKEIIRICRVKNIKLFIVSSPIFHFQKENSTSRSTTSYISLNIIQKEKVDFFDYTDDTIFKGHMDWFADFVHLNNRGATIFSQQLSHIIKNKLIRESK